MLNTLFRRAAIEVSFFRNKKSPIYTIDPLLRSMNKKYEDIDVYLDFFISARKKLSLPTQEPIKLQKNIRFGRNFKSIKRKLLNSLLDFSGNGLLKTDILLYNYKYRGFPAQTEFHFHENKLFYIECNLGDIAFQDRQELLQEIMDQYNIKDMETDIQKLSDPHGNILCIENSNDFKIIMADTSNSFFTELSNIEIFYNKKQSLDKSDKTVHQPISNSQVFEDVKNAG